MPSEPTYRIKPLEWERFATGVRVLTPVGRYLCDTNVWYGPDNERTACCSLEAAKSAAEAHYRGLLMQALEEVGDE